MLLYPAIDLRGGRCVRLYQGDYAAETVYSDSPAAVATAFAAAGAPWLHVVDLDAARTGELINIAEVEAIVDAAGVPVQYGGGVRTAAAADRLAAAGVARVVIGTAALENPSLVAEVSASQPVAVGLDVRGREIAVHGWRSGSGRTLGDVLAATEGAEALVVTQIDSDGTLEGPDMALLAEALAATEVPLIASGGVGSLDDLRRLASLRVRGRDLAGAIVGRAIYERTVDLADALGLLASIAAAPETAPASGGEDRS
jgi:phosphoribosylformimino-5-aminoimidazole carboxamide ribotide isomerase